MAEDILDWLALSLTPGIGSTLFKRLLERFGSPKAVFEAPLKELIEIEGLGEKVARGILKGPGSAEKELDLVQKGGAKVLTMHDQAYPGRLREIYDPPPVLYMRGELREEDDLAVSIVGSRKTSPYGRWMTEKISQHLARQGVTIVSGMARGIDSMAHWGAIAAEGRTIAVLGCGVDVIYPPENKNLFHKIMEQGAVLSEFPMGSLPEGAHFPKRNRIISGLSLGVVVIQAAPGSGSLITAGYALDQGREVFAVPGNVGAGASQGTHRLIKEGAKLVESGDDILDEVLPQWRNERRIEQNREKPMADLPEEERSVLNQLGETPIHIDEIIREGHFEPGRVSSLLLNLELKGMVLQWPGKCFSRKV